MRSILLTILLVFALFPVALRGAPANIIFDTDMNGDVDDIGALAILNALTNLGEARMLACVTSAEDRPDHATGATIDAINSYYGHSDVPIGAYHGTKYGYTSPYDGKVRAEFAKDFPTDDKLPAPLEIYRKALAAAPDRSVTVVTVGPMENLRELLQSPPDAISPLSGAELVKRKVKKLVAMAGRSSTVDLHSAESNMAGGGWDGGPAQVVTESWPTTILFSGFEIGIGITTGIKVKDSPASDPVRRAYELFTHFSGHPSFDPTAVLAAVRDPHLYWDVKEDGWVWVTPFGCNEWFPTPHRHQSYLVARVPNADIAKVIEELMTLPPPSK
jgi:purine nucleosidase